METEKEMKNIYRIEESTLPKCCQKEGVSRIITNGTKFGEQHMVRCCSTTCTCKDKCGFTEFMETSVPIIHETKVL